VHPLLKGTPAGSIKLGVVEPMQKIYSDIGRLCMAMPVKRLAISFLNMIAVVFRFGSVVSLESRTEIA